MATAGGKRALNDSGDERPAKIKGRTDVSVALL